MRAARTVGITATALVLIVALASAAPAGAASGSHGMLTQRFPLGTRSLTTTTTTRTTGRSQNSPGPATSIPGASGHAGVPRPHARPGPRRHAGVPAWMYIAVLAAIAIAIVLGRLVLVHRRRRDPCRQPATSTIIVALILGQLILARRRRRDRRRGPATLPHATDRRRS
jgi:hypothetical protein